MADPNSSDSAPHPWKRTQVVAIAVMVALLGIGVAARLAAPEALRSLIEQEGSKALGREVHLAELSLSLLSGQLGARGIEIGGPIAPHETREAAVPFTLEGLAASLDWWELLQGRVRLRELILESPRIALERRPDGTLVSFLLAEPSPPDPDVAASEPWPVSVDLLELRNGEASVTRLLDESQGLVFGWDRLAFSALDLRDGVVEIADLALEGPTVRVDLRDPSDGVASTEAATSSAAESLPASALQASSEDPLGRHAITSLKIRGARLSLQAARGEPVVVTLDTSAERLSAARQATFPISLTAESSGAKLRVAGELGVRPLRFDGALTWQGLQLQPWLEAFGGDAVASAQGTLTGQLDIVARSAGAESPGTLRLSGRISGHETALAISDLQAAWESLEVEIAEATVPLDGAPANVRLARVVAQAPKIAWTLRASEAVGEGDEGVSEPVQVEISQLAVSQGELRFRDETLSEPFAADWRAVEIEASDLRWPERSAAGLSLRARGPSGSRLQLRADLAGGNGRVDLSLRDLALARLDPYAVEYTGLRVDGGRATIDDLVLQLASDGARIESGLLLHDLRVRESQAGWFQSVFGLPLDTGLALLRDLKGDITLPVNATFGRGGAGVGMLDLVATALQQAIYGALVSPLKLLGRAATLASDAAGYGGPPLLEALPGHADLSEDAARRLPGLADLLASRPGLQIVLRGQAGPADDEPLALLAAEQSAGSSEPRPGEITGPEAQRRALAARRAQWVREELLTHYGLAPRQLSSAEPQEGAPGVALELRAAPEEALER